MAGMTLRQRLGLIATQAEKEQNNFVATALREAMDSLATYDVRVTGLLQANSDLVEQRRKATREEAGTRILLWSLIDTYLAGKITIPKIALQAFNAGRASLDVRKDEATGDVTITAVLLPANEAANG